MSAWVDPDSYGWLESPASDVDWTLLATRCGGGPRLEAVFEVVRASGCRTVVLENRYVDADFRSDYSAFWSKQFDSVSPFARRLHFFGTELRDDQVHDLPEDVHYLGYCVLRPGPHLDGHVGRTMIAVPPRHARAAMATAEDEVSLFGQRLSVTAAPFFEQDGEFLRCAHAAIWSCHYSAYRRGLVARRLTAELVDLVPALLSPRRALPSPGLVPAQIQAVFAATGQPALVYAVEQLPTVLGVDDPEPKLDPEDSNEALPAGLWDTRIFSVICRYLNSGFPVMVINEEHAIVLVGWFTDGDKIKFLACDDQRSPYEVIDSPFTDARAPWLAVMVPLPPKVMMSGEMAENWAYRTFRGLGSSPNAPESLVGIAQALGASPKGVSLRTFLRDGRTYKADVANQGRESEVVRELRLARLPHYVWVVEAQDRVRRSASEPCVFGELVFDPHSSDHQHREPRLVAAGLPETTIILAPDEGAPVQLHHAASSWNSHLVV